MRKQLYIIAYDISKDKNRSTAARLLEESGGQRINRSVFECMLTDSKLIQLWSQLEALIDGKTDTLASYPVCRSCYAKSRFFPSGNKPPDPLRVV